MGMTIDNTCESKSMSKEEIVENLKTMGFGAQAFERFNAKERETLDKAWNIIDQYEARLKSDMVAMLTEIQLEIEEMAHYKTNDDLIFVVDLKVLNDLIEHKIDKLKEEKDGENND